MDIFASVTFWVAVSFAGFIGLVVYLKAPKLLTDALDARTDDIRKELEEAAKLREDAQALLASYQRKQREAEKEAEDIIAQAKEEAVLLKAEMEKSLQETIERRTQLATDKIAQAEAQALQDVKDIAASVAVSAAREILEDQFDDDMDAELIEISIGEVKGKLH